MRLVYLVCALLWNINGWAHDPLWTVSLDTAQLNSLNELAQACMPALVSEVTFAADTGLSRQEFTYLTDIVPGCTITPELLQRALFYLAKKERFSRIVVQAYRAESDTVRLHFELEGFWILKSVKVQGFFVNRNQYKKLYLIPLGKPFVYDSHRHSCRRIAELMARQGYRKARVRSSLIKDHTTKSIEVVLDITRGPAFHIDAVLLHINSPQAELHAQIDASLHKHINSLFLHRLTNSVYDKERITRETRALKKFLIQKGFVENSIYLSEKVNLEAHTITLTFTITVHKKKKYSFIGNQFFSRSALSELLHLERTWMLPASMHTQEIVTAYKNVGFYDVSVESHEEGNRGIFHITEGPRAHIDTVLLHGIHSFDSYTLTSQFCTPITTQKYAHASTIQQACQNLLGYYYSQGFLDAQITNQEYIHSHSFSHGTLILTLSEGPRSYLAARTLASFDQVTLKDIFKEPLQEPVPFAMDLIAEDKKKILAFYEPETVKCTPHFTRQDALIEVAWKIEKETSAVPVTGKIVIQEPCAVPFYKIVPLCPAQKDQPLNVNDLKLTTSRLNSLDMFSQVRAYYDDDALLGTERALKIEAYQDHWLELKTRTGFALCNMASLTTPVSFSYAVGGSIRYYHASMPGDMIAADIDVNKNNRLFNISYRNPWIWQTPLYTQVDAYRTQYKQPTLYDTFPYLYQIDEYGVMGYLYRDAQWYTVECTAKIHAPKLTLCGTPVSELAHAVQINPHLLNRWMPRIMVEPSCTVQRTDNPVAPTRGYAGYLTAFLGASLSCPSTNLIKITGECAHYCAIEWPLKAVCAMRLKVGHIFYPHTLEQVLLQERFYLGGAHSIRSYQPDMSPPLGTFHDANAHSYCVPQGARSLLLVSAEARIPLYRQLGMTLFQDLGILSSAPACAPTTPSPILATGLGAWYSTPIGPVRFEIGYSWNGPRHHFSRYSWCLTVGHAF